ncbi:hypothetical protein EIN_464030 [Entamoeba invadens IP1]|uniref:Uncharacterized protein n=1 Tax=Entamoeba invadens IP1 TaxID=370355 RepID=L7FLK7_ENTIV|nr:hypothetical protein EIN_464030 [Entamoeba invadens IP1]ELP87060.1 hypothetical protein EIN_464030 [Entamoeba invadens IP1]|eukprot:XP_004253831.1 hypothetical protein EIN_464030 [Entamoeba invadens IP1]
MDANEYYKQCGICNGFGIAGSSYPAYMVIPLDNPIMGNMCYILGGVNNVYNFGFRINQNDKNHIKGEWLDKLPTDSTAKVLFSIENKICTLVKNHWVKIELDTFDVDNCEIVTKPGQCYKTRAAVDPVEPSKPVEPSQPETSEKPSEPEKPVEPSKPVDPPVTSTEPSETDKPEEQVKPEEPVTFVIPNENSEISKLDGALSMTISVLIGVVVLLM